MFQDLNSLKLTNFDQFEPEIIFSNNNVIFFETKGSILKFDEFFQIDLEKKLLLKN